MPLISERFGSTQKCALWLDFTDYAERLLGVSPWLEQAAFAAAYGRAQGLLRSDVVALDVPRMLTDIPVK